MPVTGLAADFVPAADLHCCVTASIVRTMIRPREVPALRNPTNDSEVSEKLVESSHTWSFITWPNTCFPDLPTAVEVLENTDSARASPRSRSYSSHSMGGGANRGSVSGIWHNFTPWNTGYGLESENDDMGETALAILGDFGPGRVTELRLLLRDVGGALRAALERVRRSLCTIEAGRVA